MIRSHPDENMLTEYAAGTLDSAISIAVKTHLQMCPKCREKVSRLQAVGAAMMSQVTPVELDEENKAESFTALMQRIKSQGQVAENQPGGQSIRFPKLPPIVNSLLPKDRKLKWRRVTRSLKQANLSAGQHKYEIALHKIAKGGRVASHDHRGLEVTIVLKGAFSDENGTYKAGDFIVREPGQSHQPHATQNQDCLCLTVVEAPVKLKGFVGKLLNPFLPFQPA